MLSMRQSSWERPRRAHPVEAGDRHFEKSNHGNASGRLEGKAKGRTMPWLGNIFYPADSSGRRRRGPGVQTRPRDSRGKTGPGHGGGKAASAGRVAGKTPRITPQELVPEENILPRTTLEVGPLTGPLAPYGTALEVVPPGRGGLSVGVVRVVPFIGYNPLYRTNIYQSYSNKISDVLHLFRPGLSMEIPLAGNAVFLNYLGNGFVYTKNSQNDHFDHNLVGGTVLKFPAGLEIQAGVGYRNAVEEQSSTTGQQRPYQRVIPTIQISRRLADKWLIQGNYQFDMYQFAQPENSFDNRQTHNAALTLFYKFWPRTALLFQYVAQVQNYPDFSIGNNFSQTPFLGFTWDPTAKLSGTVKFGYTFKSYDTAVPGRDNNPNSFAMSLQLLYRYSRFTQFILVAQRSNQNDLDYHNASYENTAFYFTWQKNWHYFNINSFITVSYAFNYYNSYSPFALGSNGFILPSGFQPKRQDNLYGVCVGLNRPLTKYLKIRFDYRYYNDGSTYPNISYMQHWVGLGLQTTF